MRRPASLVVVSLAVIGLSGLAAPAHVQGEGSTFVSLADSRIGGSVQIKQGGGADVLRNRVTGDVQYDEMTRLLRTDRNVVGGNVRIVKNFGGVAVNGNTIDGALQCKENRPAPTGTGNRASSKEGQCRAL